MSTALTFDISASTRLQKHLQALAVMDMAALAALVATEGEDQTRRRIEEERTAPDGSAWPEWSPAYKETRRSGHELLQSECDLVDSILADVDGTTAIWGSNLVYAALQNFGGEPVGINVPAREYLGLSENNLADIEDLIIDWIDGRTGEPS